MASTPDGLPAGGRYRHRAQTPGADGGACGAGTGGIRKTAAAIEYAEVAEQRDGHAAADRGDGALPADVEGQVVRGVDEEQADRGHERQHHELEA